MRPNHLMGQEPSVVAILSATWRTPPAMTTAVEITGAATTAPGKGEFELRLIADSTMPARPAHASAAPALVGRVSSLFVRSAVNAPTPSSPALVSGEKYAQVPLCPVSTIDQKYDAAIRAAITGTRLRLRDDRDPSREVTIIKRGHMR